MKILTILTAGVVLSFCSISPNLAEDESRFTRITDDWQDPIYRQYDFWIGLGHANWRLRTPDEFFHSDIGMLATHWVYPTLNGKALLEFALSDDPIDEDGHYTHGFSVRYYDTAKERWVMSQEWPDPNSTGGVLDQLQGFYRFGRIQVFSTFTYGDPPVEATRRYTFSDIRPEGFIWHWMATTDNGKTWVDRPMVEFSKVKPEANWPAVGEPFPNYNNAINCTDPKYKAFDDLAGEWTGTVTQDGEQREAVLTGYLMLGGCAVLNYLEFEIDGDPYTLLEVRSPRGMVADWAIYRLDSLPGTAHTYQVGNFEDGAISFYDNNQYVIEDEFKNHTLSKIPRDDTQALKKTVWSIISPEELGFQWWARETPDVEWEIEAEFRFTR